MFDWTWICPIKEVECQLSINGSVNLYFILHVWSLILRLIHFTIKIISFSLPTYGHFIQGAVFMANHVIIFSSESFIWYLVGQKAADCGKKRTSNKPEAFWTWVADFKKWKRMPWLPSVYLPKTELIMFNPTGECICPLYLLGTTVKYST